MKRWVLVVNVFGPAVFFLYADRWRKLHPGAVIPGEQSA
jgi:hypothetical protein